MKSSLISIFAALGLAATLVSCDHVAEEDRYIPYEKPEATKDVLIQEFSGLTCVNCPAAAQLLHSISETLDGKAVLVAMFPYVPVVGEPLNGFDLSCPEANEIYSTYNQELPAAKFDGGRVNSNSRRWSAMAASALSKETPLNISVTTSYDPSTRKVKASYEVEFVNNYDGELNVTLYITENNVLADQLEGSTTLPNYPHDHVLRGSFNGTYGESIGSAFTLFQKVAGEYEMTLNNAWNADNCNVVAFVSEPRSTVFNAVEVPVVK